MTNYINRRIILKGLGGAAIAAPILSSLLERSARAQTAATTKRTIIMFTYYGCITNNWFPQKLDGDLLASDLKGTSLEALSPYTAKLLQRYVKLACERLGCAPITPYQIRHGVAARVQQEFGKGTPGLGFLAAQAVLGHAIRGATQGYTGVDYQCAARVMAAMG